MGCSAPLVSGNMVWIDLCMWCGSNEITSKLCRPWIETMKDLKFPDIGDASLWYSLHTLSRILFHSVSVLRISITHKLAFAQWLHSRLRTWKVWFLEGSREPEKSRTDSPEGYTWSLFPMDNLLHQEYCAMKKEVSSTWFRRMFAEHTIAEVFQECNLHVGLSTVLLKECVVARPVIT